MRVVIVTLALVAGLAACGSSSREPRSVQPTASSVPDQEPAWATSVIADTGELSALLNRSATAAAAHSIPEVGADCMEGLNNLPDWRKHAQDVPDTSIRAPYMRALDDFESAWQACILGEYETAATGIASGTTEIQSANAAVQAFVDK